MASDPPQPIHPAPEAALGALLGGSSTVVLLQVDRSGRVVGWNAAAASRFGLSGGSEVLLTELLVAHLAEPWAGILAADPVPPAMDADFVDPDQHPFTLRCRLHRDGDLLHLVGEPDIGQEASLNRTLMAVNQELAVLSREYSRRSRELAQAKEELERTLEDLRTAYWHLEKVQEVISVCLRCGKIRADETNWETMADYLLKNEIFLSHGYCPKCGEEWAREIDEELAR